MRSFIRHHLYPAIALLLALTLITGVAYPAAVTAIAQAVFPSQANGSMIVVDGKTVGSSLIGQAFNDPKYLWGRPSGPTWGRRARPSSTGSVRPWTSCGRPMATGRCRWTS
jgi:K+-transporting ATPase ATPase C chain